MKKSLWLGGVLAGIAAYLWLSMSWMVLPFHMNSFLNFKDEAAVTAAVAANATQSGVYMLPNGHSEAQMKQWMETGPSGLAIIQTGPAGSMPSKLLFQFVSSIVAGLLMAWLLSRTSGLKYWGKVGFVVVIGVVVALLSSVSDWNWWGFSTAYTGIQIIDIIAGWFLGGLVLAKLS